MLKRLTDRVHVYGGGVNVGVIATDNGGNLVDTGAGEVTRAKCFGQSAMTWGRIDAVLATMPTPSLAAMRSWSSVPAPRFTRRRQELGARNGRASAGGRL